VDDYSFAAILKQKKRPICQLHHFISRLLVLFWYLRDHARLCNDGGFSSDIYRYLSCSFFLDFFALGSTRVTELIAWNDRHCMLDRVQLEYSWYGLHQRDENKILSCLPGTTLTIFRSQIYRYYRKVFVMIMLHFPLEVVLLDHWLQKQPFNIRCV